MRCQSDDDRPQTVFHLDFGCRPVTDGFGKGKVFQIRGPVVKAAVLHPGVVSGIDFGDITRLRVAIFQRRPAPDPHQATRNKRFYFAGRTNRAQLLLVDAGFGEHAQIEHRPHPVGVLHDDVSVVENVWSLPGWVADVSFVEMVHVLAATRHHTGGASARRC